MQGVDLTLESGVLSVVGRNGMGKTTLCKTIMGLVRATGGSVRMGGEDLLSLQPAQIARLGVGYVPQGRRLWRSLTVDEHLRMTASMRRGAWTVERIYDTFPRLAERKNNGGGQLSGGEQQMLAISRALVTNPRLLIMDEPTEGLAPVIVSQVEEMLVRLGEEGDISVLVIEQNIGVATAVANSVAIMVNGRVNRVIDSARLAADRDLQQRLLGVGRHFEAEAEANAEARDEGAEKAASPRPKNLAPVRVYISNPTPPTRWSQPVPIARIESGARALSTGVLRLEEAARPRRDMEAARSSGRPTVLVVGTLDTKGEELRFIRDIVAGSGLRARLVDVSTAGKAASCDVSAQEIALNHPRGGSAVFGPDRGASVTAMAEAFTNWLRRQGDIVGVISAGGSGGASLGGAGHARASDRRAQGHHILGRLGRCRALCRARRHHHDVLGHRRAGAEFDLAPGARQRRQRAGRHGEGAARRAGGERARAERRSARDRPDDVRRHHARRAADRGGLARRLRMPGLPRHRRRRPLDGEAGRFRPAVGRDRPHHHRGLRSPDGRRVPGDRGSLRRR